MEDASNLIGRARTARTTPEPIVYWSLLLATVAALVALGAHPVKAAGLAIGSLAAWRFGLALFGPYLGLALFFPQAGGPFPAILSLPDLLLVPLLLRLACTPEERPSVSPALWAALALAVAVVAALAVGVFVRDAPLRPSLFTAYQQVGHMASLVLASAVVRKRSGARALAGWAIAGACASAALGLAQVLGGAAVVELQQGLAASLGYPAYGGAHVERFLWWGVRKAFAGYYSPNGLGAALTFALMLTVGRLLRVPSRLDVAAAAILGAGLVATFSRGALLAASVTLLVLAWRSVRASRWRAAAPLAAMALLLPGLYGVLLHGSTAAEPVSEAIRGGGGVEAAAPLKRRSAAMKLDEARNLLAMWREGVGLLGAGYGVTYRAGDGFTEEPHAVGISSAYAEIVYRSGVVGALALVVAALSLRRVWRRHGSTRPGGHPFQPALFGALVHSAIDHPFLTVPGLVAIFWAGWGVLEAD